MDKNIIYLTADEQRAIRIFAKGQSSREIQRQCVLPLSGMAFFTIELRRKTGIQNLRLASECQSYLERYAQALDNLATNPLSNMEVHLLRAFAGGMGLAELAYTTETPPTDFLERLNTLLTRCGIFTQDQRTQKIQAKIHMAAYHTPDVSLSISASDWLVLRTWCETGSCDEAAAALGWKYDQRYIRLTAQDACKMLGLSSQGKNAQLFLMRLYFAHVDLQAAQTPDAPLLGVDPMADPAF